MIINHYYDCPSCKSKNKVSIDADDRGQLQKQIGDEIGCSCSSCHKKEKIHINKIYAESTKIGFILGFVISCVITMLFWNLGFAIVLTFGLPMAIYLYQQSLARNFNNYRIKK